jgi:hypothetical protein
MRPIGRSKARWFSQFQTSRREELPRNQKLKTGDEEIEDFLSTHPYETDLILVGG